MAFWLKSTKENEPIEYFEPFTSCCVQAKILVQQKGLIACHGGLSKIPRQVSPLIQSSSHGSSGATPSYLQLEYRQLFKLNGIMVQVSKACVLGGHCLTDCPELVQIQPMCISLRSKILLRKDLVSRIGSKLMHEARLFTKSIKAFRGLQSQQFCFSVSG